MFPVKGKDSAARLLYRNAVQKDEMGQQETVKRSGAAPTGKVDGVEPAVTEELPADPWWTTLLKEEPAFAVSLLYLALGAAGSYYYTQLFARFGINIFYYAEVSDFLLVIFREPLVPGLTLAAGLVLYLVYRIDGVLDSRFPRYKEISGFFQRWLERDSYFGKRRRSQRVWEALVALIVILFVRYITPFCVRYTVNDILHSTHRQVVLIVYGNSGNRPQAPRENMRLIGTTGRFLFLFEPVSRQVHIVPMESTGRLIVGNDQSGSRPDPPDGTTTD